MIPVVHDVDGVCVLHLPGSSVPYRAGLTFRVGMADESPATSGITHLVEHLALHHLAPGDRHSNGATTATHTHFHSWGTAAEVVAFVNGVCSALASLPFDRMSAEKAILLTESSGRGSVPPATLYRHGATGSGLAALAEFGVPTLDAETVQQWTASWFTRGNLVLWVSGPEIPEGFDLSPLPDGDLHDLEEPVSQLPDGPCWFGHDAPLVHVSADLVRSPAALVFAHLLERVAFRELRHESVLSYHAQTTHRRLSVSTVQVELVADALPDQLDALVGGVVDVLEGVRLRLPTEADLDAARRAAAEPFTHPEQFRSMLPALAEDLLQEQEPLSAAETHAALMAVTAEEVRAVAGEFKANALAQVPVIGLDWAGWRDVNGQVLDPVQGKTVRSLDGEHQLVLSPDGVTFVAGSANVTVRYTSLALLIDHADGGIEMIGNDACTIRIEPTLFPLTPDERHRLVQRADPARTVRRPARRPDEIPRPDNRRRGFSLRRR